MTGCTTRRPLSPEKTDHVHVVLEWAIPRGILEVVVKIRRIFRQNV